MPHNEATITNNNANKSKWPVTVYNDFQSVKKRQQSKSRYAKVDTGIVRLVDEDIMIEISSKIMSSKKMLKRCLHYQKNHRKKQALQQILENY